MNLPRFFGWISFFGYVAAAQRLHPNAGMAELAEHAKMLFANFHGIGHLRGEELDEKIAEVLEQPRCGNSDTQMLTAEPLTCKWSADVKTVPLYFQSYPETLPLSEWRAVFMEAWAMWYTVAAIPNMVVTGAASEALIVVQAANIDGPSKVLADMELPCGQTRPRRMRIDAAEAWSKSARARRISASQTVLHELGHALGLNHGTSGVMAPSLSADMPPQPADIAALRGLYGPPRQDPPVPPVPPTPASREITVKPGETVLIRGVA